MSTIKIRNVDIPRLKDQRLLLPSLPNKTPEGNAKDALRGIIHLLDSWYDDLVKKELGSLSNQKAKQSQYSFTDLRQCELCNHQTTSHRCPVCMGPTELWYDEK